MKLLDCYGNCKKIAKTGLMTICKVFARPHLNYSDVIHDEAYSKTFLQKLKSIQYVASSDLSRTIRGSSSETLYQELSL